MNIIECTNCDGTGYLWNNYRGSSLDEDNYDICEVCDGYGYRDEEIDS